MLVFLKEFSHLILPLRRRVVFTPSFHRERFRRRATYTRPQQTAFLLARRECFYERSSSRSFQRERERERDHTTHSYRPFLRLERKSPRVSSVFFNPHRLFLPQKKEKIITLNNARKFSRVLKHFFKRVSRTNANEKVFHERAREILFVLTSSSRLEDAFY